MTINTFDQWIAASKQIIPYSKMVARVTVANRWFAMHDVVGNPGAATLAAGNSANGAVPNDSTTGFPPVVASSGVGYLSDVDFGCTVACRLTIYDRLFHAGAFNFNDAIALTSQPSFSSRVPGGSYVGTQLWYEQVTGATGNQSVAVTYTNQAGVTAHTTGTISTGAAFTLGSMVQLPLAAGDSGLQKVESVTGSVASAGTFNIVVLRPLWTGRVAIANGGNCHALDRTGMPQVPLDAALALMLNADSTSSGLPDLALCIAAA